MEKWLAENWLALWGAVTGTLGMAFGGWAAWSNWLIARNATQRRKPVITAFPTAFVAYPGWHEIQLTVRNYAEAPLQLTTIAIDAPLGARLVNRATIEGPDGFGGAIPKPDKLLSQTGERSATINFELPPVRGDGEPYTFRTEVYAHSRPSKPSGMDRPPFKLRFSFSWSDRLNRRFEITIDTKQPT